MSQGGYSTLEMRSRAVFAVERGQPLGQVAEAYGVDRTTLFRWRRRFMDGQGGLERRIGSGRPRLLAALDM
jgi:transposase-like protein